MFSSIYKPQETFEDILRKEESFNNPRLTSMIGRSRSNTGNDVDLPTSKIDP